MGEVLEAHWPQFAALFAFVAWLIRLESAVKQQGAAQIELRREQAEITRRAQDQAVMLARIDESLSAIKRTLDRMAEQINGRT